jgi:phosphotransferase system  glucose/maltose/N-acetylglucosamine-specific IIC component
MIGFERQRKMFAAQFQPDGVGFLYRNHTIGEPISVSAVERDRYIAAFGKFTHYGFWAMIAGAAVLLAVFVLYSLTTQREVPDTISWSAFGVMIVLYMAAYLRAWNFPLRDLQRRR